MPDESDSVLTGDVVRGGVIVAERAEAAIHMPERRVAIFITDGAVELGLTYLLKAGGRTIAFHVDRVPSRVKDVQLVDAQLVAEHLF